MAPTTTNLTEALHAVRQPLGVIEVYAELIASSENLPAAHTYAAQIKKSVDRLTLALSELVAVVGAADQSDSAPIEARIASNGRSQATT
jgi:hypothetical protein